MEVRTWGMMYHNPLAQHATRWWVRVCVCALWRLHRRGGLWVTERLIDKRKLTGAESQWGPRERTFSRWWSRTPWTPEWWSPPRPPPRWWWRGFARWKQSQLMRWTHKHTRTDVQKQRNAQHEPGHIKDYNLQDIIEPNERHRDW